MFQGGALIIAVAVSTVIAGAPGRDVAGRHTAAEASEPMASLDTDDSPSADRPLHHRRGLIGDGANST